MLSVYVPVIFAWLPLPRFTKGKSENSSLFFCFFTFLLVSRISVSRQVLCTLWRKQYYFSLNHLNHKPRIIESYRLSHSTFTELLELRPLYWPEVGSQYISETHSSTYSAFNFGNVIKHNTSPDPPASEHCMCLRDSLQQAPGCSDIDYRTDKCHTCGASCAL